MNSIRGNEEMTQGRPEHGVLTQVYEGMDVYDVEGEKVGTVEKVFVGGVAGENDQQGSAPATTPVPLETRDETFVDDIAEAFDPQHEIPEVVRERLLRHGFIRVEGPEIFEQEQYITPEQIASVTDDEVRLRVSRSELYEA